MLAAMVHRGSDQGGTWAGEGVVLGARRLAIMDPAGGRQPLSNESGTVQVVFNGEIYDHEQLREELHVHGHQQDSRSDGEVIPHLYEKLGGDLFDRLEVMFAIAVWDTQRRTVLLARDRIGVKPLYLSRSHGQIRFASEIRRYSRIPWCLEN
jgi:asparagine synthase (glutamine-hydrolysing)